MDLPSDGCKREVARTARGDADGFRLSRSSAADRLAGSGSPSPRIPARPPRAPRSAGRRGRSSGGASASARRGRADDARPCANRRKHPCTHRPDARLPPHPSGGGSLRSGASRHPIGDGRGEGAPALELDRDRLIVRDARPTHRERRASGRGTDGEHRPVREEPWRKHLGSRGTYEHGGTSRRRETSLPDRPRQQPRRRRSKRFPGPGAVLRSHTARSTDAGEQSMSGMSGPSKTIRIPARVPRSREPDSASADLRLSVHHWALRASSTRGDSR